MVTTGTAVSPPGFRSRWPLVLGLLLGLVVLVVLCAVGWFYSAARSALPQLDGSAQIVGLGARVTVTRDGHGVPTIEASSLEDLFFAQGYVTAQDRLWQMDIMRRFAAGELAEILGPDLVKHDREQRTLGLRVAARKAVEVASPQVRSHYEAYARGVNAYIESHRERLPLEFRILRYVPRSWSPEDSTLIAAQMVKDLSTSPRAALAREKILAKLGPELTADLYVNASWHDRPPTVMPASLDEGTGDKNENNKKDDEDEEEDSGADSSVTRWMGPFSLRETLNKYSMGENTSGNPRLFAGEGARATLVQSFLRQWALTSLCENASFAPLGLDVFPLSTQSLRSGLHSCAASRLKASAQTLEGWNSDADFVVGSNNWVVSGAHTVSGKPLLSNDMHLGHQMPNLWYEAHLHAGDFEVAGVTLPGIPYVIVGHNQRIAWGFTNLGPSVEDAYIETFNSEGQYLTPGGWKAAEHRAEVIHVKGRPDVILDVRLTRHGPLVTDLVPGEARQIALRWTLYDGIHNPFLEVDAAQNWDQFRRAFSAFDAPGQNVVYADVDGNIGYQATGKIPIRTSGDGSLPENGSDDAHEWTGYVPFEKLPSICNPSSGIVATANSRITPDGYAYSLSAEWEAPWRTARIYRVLESGRKFSAADMLGLQTDIYADAERYFAERFAYGVDHAKNPSARAKQAADILRQWDGRMTAESAAPTISSRTRAELMRLLLETKLGAAPKDPAQSEATLSWKTYHWMLQSVWLENVTLHQPKRWLPDGYPNYDELLTAAVEAAIKDAHPELGAWKWGNVNAVEIQNPVLGRIPFLNRWTGPGVQPQSGSGFTVKAVSRSHGPSERFTADLADLDQSTLNLVTGEAGNFLSPYYMDQWRAWYEGQTFILPFSKSAVGRARAHQLVLEPK
jgi:penicillin amidase